jgi:hypothetical protein
MAEGTIFGRTDDKTVAQFLTTHQVFVDIRFAVGDSDPPRTCRRTPHALTGLGPDLGLAGTFEPLLR